jgi:adenine phosphoribosyltransferase
VVPGKLSWWRRADLIADLGPVLAGMFSDEEPTVVMGIEASGMMLGPLVSLALGVGFAPVRKTTQPDYAGDPLLTRTTPPDHRNRGIALTVRASLIRRQDRVVLVDDWADTGAQATAVRALVADAGATWLGVAAVIDGLPPQARRKLDVRSLLHERALG